MSFKHIKNVPVDFVSHAMIYEYSSIGFTFWNNPNGQEGILLVKVLCNLQI